MSFLKPQRTITDAPLSQEISRPSLTCLHLISLFLLVLTYLLLCVIPHWRDLNGQWVTAAPPNQRRESGPELSSTVPGVALGPAAAQAAESHAQPMQSTNSEGTPGLCTWLVLGPRTAQGGI